jgi:hypothetical protein
MLQSGGFLLSLLLLTSCSLYSSAGRKQFEEKAPNSIQSFSLQSCREMSAAETWLREEFPNSSHELIEMHPDYEVWGKPLEDGQMEVTVISQDSKITESCVYKFESRKTWQIYKKSFLDELSRSLVSLD